MAAQCWQVVGGEDKGGILVRRGKDLTSQKEGCRLSHRAVVKELSFDEDTGRLYYELVQGTGPQKGWVSINIFGRVLCSKVKLNDHAQHQKLDTKSLKHSEDAKEQRHWTGETIHPPRSKLAQWSTTGPRQAVAKIWRRDLTVRTLDGSVIFAQRGVTSKTSVSEVLTRICDHADVRYDLAQVLYEGSILKAGRPLGECITPSQGPLEVTLLKASLDVGPAVTSRSMSGSAIEVLGSVPAVGDKCHFDREYMFQSLGDFAKRPRMRYLKTSNDDKLTPSSQTMWQLTARMPVTVGLNFRSEGHVTDTGASAWLQEGDWQRSSMSSTVTTGYPNGPYSGPVYFKVFEAGIIDLMGSNCEEGTYFVFIELR